MSYYFSFFRIFRFEHSKLTQFFTDYSLVDPSQLAQVDYNQNLNRMGELKYNNFHVNNNFKLLSISGYFAMMPLLLTVDFFLLHCVSQDSKIYRYLNERIVAKFFFSGPMALYSLSLLPMGLSAVLELRFFTV